MRVLLPLAVLALAACDPPMGELFPPRFYTFDRDGIAYDVRAQYDPFAMSWFTRVTSIERPLEADDEGLATALVEQDLGREVCGGNMLAVRPGEVWNPMAGDRVAFLEDLGSFQLVGRCSSTPAPPPVMSVISPWGAPRTTFGAAPGPAPGNAPVTVVVGN